ncbi:dethiobiotin synthase [Calidifontibacter terrae]
MTPVLIITGTDTEIGKTVTTAAVAAALASQGQRVAMVKIAQTGLSGDEEGDAQTVARLAGVVVREFVRLPEPLAPDVAARRAGVTIPSVADHAAALAELCRSGDFDVVLAEGSGGLLVNLDADGGNIGDLGKLLSNNGIRAGYVVVCRSGLGTLNHTQLTLEALEHRGGDLIGVVIGSSPRDPDLATRTNLEELRRIAGGPLLGSIPADAGILAPAEFRAAAPSWVTL